MRSSVGEYPVELNPICGDSCKCDISPKCQQNKLFWYVAINGSQRVNIIKVIKKYINNTNKSPHIYWSYITSSVYESTA